GGAVEIRLQEHQVDREDAVRGGRADQYLAAAAAERVRLLRERESAGRSSTVVAGAGGPAAESVQEHPDADVQRVRRPGRQPVRRDGSPQVLLTRIAILKVLVFAAALIPAAALVYGFYTQDLTAN